MPRLSPSLVKRAYSISPHAAALLPVCRDLPSALNELRWIRDFARAEPADRRKFPLERRVAELCRQRGKGVPLQYVLGTQPFGHLDIKCRPGVLVPRPEPEAYTTHLAGLIKNGLLRDQAGLQPSALSVIDFCTGTGCIALLLYSLLQASFKEVHIAGVDISPKAVSLARENIRYNATAGNLRPPSPPHRTLDFFPGDMFAPDWDALAPPATASGGGRAGRRWDIMTCNPPYISRAGFARDTARSVRNYEPRLAQVPLPRAGYAGVCAPEDVFYARLLEVAAAEAGPRALLCEVGDMGQARRVVELALALGRQGVAGGAAYGEAEIEIWRDWPDMAPEEGEESEVEVVGGGDGGGRRRRRVVVRGSGLGRAVFIVFGERWDGAAS